MIPVTRYVVAQGSDPLALAWRGDLAPHSQRSGLLMVWFRLIPAAAGTHPMGTSPLPALWDLSQSPAGSVCGLSHPLNAPSANSGWRGPRTGQQNRPRPEHWSCLQLSARLRPALITLLIVFVPLPFAPSPPLASHEEVWVQFVLIFCFKSLPCFHSFGKIPFIACLKCNKIRKIKIRHNHTCCKIRTQFNAAAITKDISVTYKRRQCSPAEIWRGSCW